MSVAVLHDSRAGELELPGRALRWLISDDTVPARFCSVCAIRIAPGGKVSPAHSHPHGEEVIHILSGFGRVLVSGEVADVRKGSTVLFPQGAVHMLHNTSEEEMRVVCFFAPGTSLANYEMSPEADFPSAAP